MLLYLIYTIHFRFHSDGRCSGISCSDKKGFKFEYSTLELFSACGGSFSNESGILTSPSYPDPYPHMANCVYFISQPNDRYVNISFINMDIDCHGTPSDYIEIRDGSSEDSPLMGTFCGKNNTIPPVMMSTQNYLRIR